MLVGGMIVHDQMNIQAFRHSLIDALEELKKLLMTVAWLALRQDRAGCDVESGKQGGGAMANVVVGHSFNEEWIAGQLEVLAAVRLNGKCSEDAMDR